MNRRQGVDPFLSSVVRQAFDERERSDTDSIYLDLAPQNILDELLNKFPEYRRKNQSVLLKEITQLISKFGTIEINNSMPSENRSDASVSSTPRSKPSKVKDIHVIDNLNIDSSHKESLKESAKKRKRRLSTNNALSNSVKRERDGDKGMDFLFDVSPNMTRDRLVKKCPKVRFSDLGGVESLLPSVRETCEFPLKHREMYKHLGVSPPTGVLLIGPPGCGKTMLAFAIAGEMQVPFFKLSAPEVISSMSGGSESKIRNLFDLAKKYSPSIIFIDELDSITAKRDNSQKAMETRIVAQLISSMDNLAEEDFISGPLEISDNNSERSDKPQDKSLPQVNAGVSGETTEQLKKLSRSQNKGVLVIGATSRPDSLDNSLRQTNRFDREIMLGIPDAKGRLSILKALTKKMKVSGDFDYQDIVYNTPGFVGSDLAAVCKEAASIAVKRAVDKQAGDADATMQIGEDHTSAEHNYENLALERNDFSLALKKVQPSAKREGFATVPQVTWEDIGALDHIQEELRLAITEPILQPEKFERFNINVGGGVLLYGPPGCGKTLLAKAVANQSQANFISVKGPELMNKFVGESERGVRQVFSRARASAPCVIFFDEIDSLCPKRGTGGGDSGVRERVVNQLLTEMDGVEERKAVFIIAATNRPDIIDPALLRPGRLDKVLYIRLPDEAGRTQILQTLLKKVPCDNSLAQKAVIQLFARRKELRGFSGADLAALVKEASLEAIRTDKLELTLALMESALQKVKRSVSNAAEYDAIDLAVSEEIS